MDKKKATSAYKEFREAMVSGDFDRLAEMMDSDMQWIHGSGRVDNKDSLLKALKGGRLQNLSLEHRDHSVRVKGDVALLSGILTIMANIEGNARKMEHRCTMVLSDYSGELKVLNWHPTVIS